MISYSVSARPNPREKSAPPRYYASPQVSDNVTMDEFCRHIASHGSVYSRSVHVNWTPGMDFRNLQRDAEWNLVANRRAQRLLLKAVTSGETSVDLSKENEDEEEEQG